ncbi:hypothetical protein ABTM99_19840, partial [Acinetobacter baumannii]
MTDEQPNSAAVQPARPEPAAEPLKPATLAAGLARLELRAEPEPQVEAETPLLRIDGVAKKFGNFRAVDHVTLDIRAGEFFA